MDGGKPKSHSSPQILRVLIIFQGRNLTPLFHVLSIWARSVNVSIYYVNSN